MCTLMNHAVSPAFLALTVCWDLETLCSKSFRSDLKQISLASFTQLVGQRKYYLQIKYYAKIVLFPNRNKQDIKRRKHLLTIHFTDSIYIITKILLQIQISHRNKCPLLTTFFSLSFFLSSSAWVTFLPEGVIVGFWNFAWTKILGFHSKKESPPSP